MVRPRAYQRILVAEPDPGMREILVGEIGERVSLPVEGVSDAAVASHAGLGEILVVALATRAAKIRDGLPPGTACLALRLRSVRGTLEGQARPTPNMVVAVVSRSVEIRFWARAMLLAVGLEPERLCEIDAGTAGWRDRVAAGLLAVTDIVTAGELPAGCDVRVFRVISDESLMEVKQFCGGANAAR